MPKQVLALAKQAVHDALTFEDEHIEHAEHDEVGSFRPALHAGAGLQALEVATAQLVEHPQLAVETRDGLRASIGLARSLATKAGGL
jgi:hypothetical protein